MRGNQLNMKDDNQRGVPGANRTQQNHDQGKISLFPSTFKNLYLQTFVLNVNN